MLIIGTNGSDILDGSADPDEIQGLDGDDTLYGHGGEDTLFGGDGDDLLFGGDGDDVLDGGAGNDTLWGGGGADRIIFGDGYGHDVVMDFDVVGGTVGLVASGVTYWEDVQARLFDDADGTALLILDDGSSLRFEGLTVADLEQHHFNLPSAPVCFVAGTLIATERGAVLVERLRIGDLVQTLDDGLQPILWIGRRRTSFGHLAHRHQPVVIRAGAMGHGLPSTDLRLSPQHRLLVAGPDGRRFARGGLAKAKALCGRPGIVQDTACTSVEYVQILLPRHGLVFANGLPAETFLPRAFALASLPEADRADLLQLVPGLADDPDHAYGPPARPILSVRLIEGLPERALRSLPHDVEQAAAA
ncbi:Hint domain-containing protein [Roseicyclus mahoneyensis]|uniref:Hemolysin type calcium-binding protein n=1 Tax=Roseicyclus mahoneyensis TaxID=164332 RepID=A0A316H4S9_9RHOB|nr:Hint domain-containing protein [Roseicyclus mahoneyensis]PWK62583.1 hemolysin type calcium-binding protein [Roseicyclus mahoneyensis]